MNQVPDAQGALPTRVWGPRRSFAALAATLVLLIIEVTIATGFDPGLDSLATKLILQAALAGTLICVALIAAGVGGALAVPATLGLRRPGRGAIAAAGGAYLVYVGCALVISVLLAPEQEDVTRELGADEGVLGVLAAGFLIIAVAPVSEEIFFRGFLFGGLRVRAPFAVAALVSAGIWGIFHYTDPDSWGVVVQLTVFGVVLAWLYERTGSIWPTIAVHAFNNSVAFTILLSS